jgi:RNA polymerase sigma-70 factor (sigma-E family)
MASATRAEQEAEYVEFVSAQLASLRRTAYLLCGDPHRADDLVQQTITKLYVRWHRMSGINHPDRYVRTMLIREFLDERRLSWARVRLFGQTPDEAPQIQPSTEDRLVVRAALQQLPKRQRAVIILRFLCDLPVDEVAEILGIAEGTPKGR